MKKMKETKPVLKLININRELTRIAEQIKEATFYYEETVEHVLADLQYVVSVLREAIEDIPDENEETGNE
ncbi:MAG: hypothetical protein LBJ96_00375 [Holosporaceae bacterium]|jgi:flagellar biosynthesis chaperone FliJ|nr:hypothetical protein [Holosporaceae bacterium]